MKKIRIKSRSVDRISINDFISFIFYLLLLCPILSPNVKGVSSYIFLFIPFLDIQYLNYLINMKLTKTKWFVVLFLVIYSLVYFDLLFLLKIISIIEVVSYVIFTIEKNRFYLNQIIILNIIIAIIQFIGYKFFSVRLFDPKMIGDFLYGNNALGTGKTFAQGNLFLGLRVSGLSTEPGFFNSLLIVSSLLVNKVKKLSAVEKALYAIGILVSFSKISIAFFFVFLLTYPFKSFIKKIPIIFVFIIILFVMIISVSSLYNVFNYNELGPSIFHRTIGYNILTKLNYNDLFFGVGFRNIRSRADEIPIIRRDEFFAEKPEVIVDGSGLSTIIIDHGILFSLFLILILMIFKVDSYHTLLFSVFTINVNPFTTSAFVLLGYVYLFLNSEINKSEQN